MLSLRLSLSETQKRALDHLNNPRIVDLLFGGGAGGAKSMLVCIWMAIECRDYPGIKIGLGRKELTRLKQTTVATLLRKVHPLLNIKAHEFVYNDQKGLITYANGSQIQLVDLKRQPSDPDFDTFGSLEFTHIVIEEVGEVVKQAVDVLSSRKNRWLNKEYGIVGKTVMTCNPTNNFIRQEYYEPYKKLGMGPVQVWEDGEVIIPGGERVSALKAFIRSLVTDNPFADDNYIEELKRKPGPIRKRLFEGNWDYDDSDNLVFPSYLIDRALISEFQVAEDAVRAIGVDIADKGNDRTILSYVDNNILMDQVPIEVDIGAGAKPIGEQIALAIIKYAQQRKVTSRNIAIDSIGVGASTRDFLKAKGWHVLEFIASNGSELSGFNNLRAESLWQLREDMEADNFKISSNLATLTELRKELMAHEYDDEDAIIKIRSKKKIKEDIGHSPDYADSANIARWAARGKKGARYNNNRIIY